MNSKNLLAGVFSAALILGTVSGYCRELRPEPSFDGRPPHHEQIDRFHHKMAERLKLTDEQKKQAEEIRKAGREKVKPLMDEMKQIREKMDAVRAENMKEFEKILSDEQKTELEKIKAEKKAEFKARRHHRGERPMPPKDHPLPPRPEK